LAKGAELLVLSIVYCLLGYWFLRFEIWRLTLGLEICDFFWFCDLRFGLSFLNLEICDFFGSPLLRGRLCDLRFEIF